MADTIKQKIVFAMGTTGTQQATKSIGSMAVKVVALGAGIAIAVKGMSKMYDAAVTLDRQLQSLNTDMGLYNQQTKGLIDTNDGLSAAIQLQNANISASAEEMAAMGKAAIKMNQDLGGKAGGSTEIFNGLVKSIVNARETGLVKFGIELSQTGDKAAASKEAMQKLVEKFGDVNVEAETAKEKMYAFNNSLGTVAAAQFNGILHNMSEVMMGVADSTGNGISALQQFEQDIMDTNGTITEYTGSLAGMHRAGAEWIATMLNDRHTMMVLDMEYQNHLSTLKEIEAIKARTAGYKERSKQLDENSADFANVKGQGDVSSRDMRISGRNLQSRARGKTSAELAKFPLLNEFVQQGGLTTDYSEKPVKAKSTGRSRTKEIGLSQKQLQLPPKIQIKELQQFDIQEESGLSLDLSSDAGAGASRAQAEQSKLAREAQFQQQLANLKLGAQQSTLSMMLGMEQQYLDESNRMNAISNQQKAQTVTDLGSTTVGIMDNTAKAVDASSRKGFKVTQAMNYASNAINTVQSSIAGYKSVMNSAIPFPWNVAAGGALATSIGVAGAVAGNKIRNQKYGSTSGTSSVKVPKTSFPSGGIGTGGGSTGGDTVINVRVGGNTIHREVMSANDLANQSGDKHFTTGEI